MVDYTDGGGRMVTGRFAALDGQLLTVHLCSLRGVVRRYHGVERWLFHDGWLMIVRNGEYQSHKLERQHIGAFATVTP